MFSSSQQKQLKMDTVTELLTMEYQNKNEQNKKFGCKFTMIDPDKDFYIFKTINEIIRHVEQSTKKTPINKISTRLLRLQFKSDIIIKSKAIKLFVKKILPDYK